MVEDESAVCLFENALRERVSQSLRLDSLSVLCAESVKVESVFSYDLGRVEASSGYRCIAVVCVLAVLGRSLGLRLTGFGSYLVPYCETFLNSSFLVGF